MGLRGTTTGTFYNNAFINSGANFSNNTHDYNAADSALGEAHDITNLTTAAFVNHSGKNFRPSTGSVLVNHGTSLASEYNQDMEGNVRGADGTWDIGAFEVTSPHNAG